MVEPGKKPSRRAWPSIGGRASSAMKSAHTGSTLQRRIVAPQPRRRRIEMLARNIDRRIERQLWQRLDQQARLHARAAAELDQRASPVRRAGRSRRRAASGSRSRCASGNIPAARRSRRTAPSRARRRGTWPGWRAACADRPSSTARRNSSRSAVSAKSRVSTEPFIGDPLPGEFRRTSSAHPAERSCDKSCGYGHAASRRNRPAAPSGWP